MEKVRYIVDPRMDDEHSLGNRKGGDRLKKKKCYIYTRVSTMVQTEGYSLDAQQEKLRKYAEYKNLEITREYCDAGKSGKSIKGRPAFQQMMEDVASQKDDVSCVLVFKLSRFGRNAADVLKSLQLLMDYEVDLVSVDDEFYAGRKTYFGDSISCGRNRAREYHSSVPVRKDAEVKRRRMAGRSHSLWLS